MNSIIDTISQPWPWYVAGPLIGLMVPFLLVVGNKSFGISSNLRHICAACLPANISFFRYPWKQESWNLIFALGVLGGGIIAGTVLKSPAPMIVNPELVKELSNYQITVGNSLSPTELFSVKSLMSLRGFLVIVVGGFLVGFGTRYADGCTSGHSIFGISTLQLASVIATVAFMLGGFLMANFILPYILKL